MNPIDKNYAIKQGWIRPSMVEKPKTKRGGRVSKSGLSNKLLVHTVYVRELRKLQKAKEEKV